MITAEQAMEALERLVYGHNAANMGYEEQRILYDTIKAALQSEREKADGVAELEPSELENFMVPRGCPRKWAKVIVENIATMFPNGIKIVKGDKTKYIRADLASPTSAAPKEDGDALRKEAHEAVSKLMLNAIAAGQYKFAEVHEMGATIRAAIDDATRAATKCEGGEVAEALAFFKKRGHIVDIIDYESSNEVVKHIKTLITAAQRSQPAEDGWRPIETAPRDGTLLLLWGNGYTIGYYEKTKDTAEFKFDGWTTGFETAGNYDIGYISIFPTHWQPFPAPPIIKPKDEVKT